VDNKSTSTQQLPVLMSPLLPSHTRPLTSDWPRPARSPRFLVHPRHRPGSLHDGLTDPTSVLEALPLRFAEHGPHRSCAAVQGRV